MNPDVIKRLRAALPQVRDWIEQFVDAHAARARPLTQSLGCARLRQHFPEDFLARSKIVDVARVTFPPVDTFGLPEFAPMRSMPFDGITFKDTIFVNQPLNYGLHFHELVHVAQWARLGVDQFLLAYGVGLAEYGYQQSPLEHMAYSLQGAYEAGRGVPDLLIPFIEARTDAIWAEIASSAQAR